MCSLKFLLTALSLFILANQHVQAAPGGTIAQRGWGWFFTCDCPLKGKLSGKGQGLCVPKEECDSKSPDSDNLRRLVEGGAKLEVNWKQTLSCRSGGLHGPAPPAMGLICCCPDKHVPEGNKKTEPKTNPKGQEHGEGSKKHASSDEKSGSDKHADGKNEKEDDGLTFDEVKKIVSKLGGVWAARSMSPEKLDKELEAMGAAVTASGFLAAIRTFGGFLALFANPF